MLHMVVLANKCCYSAAVFVYYHSVIVYVVIYLRMFWTNYFGSFSRASLLDRRNDEIGDFSN